MNSQTKDTSTMEKSIDQQANLSQQAEALLQAKRKHSPEQLKDLSPEALQNILQELTVYQVELELQNEELRRVQIELAAAKARYFELYDLAPVGYLTVSKKGLITQTNLAAATLLGLLRRELVKRPLSNFIVNDDQGSYYKFRNLVFESNEQQALNVRMLNKDGTPLWVHLEAIAVADADGEPTLRVTLSNITRLIQAELALRESDVFKQAILNSMSSQIAVLDSHGVIIAVNEPWRRFAVDDGIEFGVSARHSQIGSNYVAACKAAINSESSEDDQKAYRGILMVLGGHLPNFTYEYACHSPNQQRWFMATITPLGSEKGGAVIVHSDITARKQAEISLRIAAIAFESQMAMIVTDAHGIIMQVNKAFTTLTGYSPEEVIGKSPHLLSSGRHDKAFYQTMWATLLEKGHWQGEIWNRNKEGNIYAGWLTISAVIDLDGNTTHYVGAYFDITQNKEATAEIHRLAYYDPLTKLPNRRLLQDRLNQALSASTRNNLYGAVLFMDMDNFKTLNDTRGHEAGDQLLVEVARRLKTVIREYDTLARLGGDEFVVLLEDLDADTEVTANLAQHIGEKMVAALAQPYIINDFQHHCTVSIGISLFCGSETSEELLNHADLAMYQVKTRGRNGFCFFDSTMQDKVTARVAIEKDLRYALEQQQFKLHFQMQATHNRQIIGAEVLLCWEHPERGLVSAFEFIYLAEENGLILPIGQWVLEAACTQLKSWGSRKQTQHLQLAVNVSPSQFHQADFVKQVVQVLQRHAVNPNRLKLEITESMLLNNIDDIIFKMQELKKIGVQFSMDDFGSGFSSLAYLSQLPLDQLKIDQSFVRNIGVKPTDAVIVQTIVGMADNLGMTVIAEGVETEQQRAFLELHGCPVIQGYLFGRPVPIEQFEALLKQG